MRTALSAQPCRRLSAHTNSSSVCGDPGAWRPPHEGGVGARGVDRGGELVQVGVVQHHDDGASTRAWRLLHRDGPVERGMHRRGGRW